MTLPEMVESQPLVAVQREVYNRFGLLAYQLPYRFLRTDCPLFPAKEELVYDILF